MDVETAPASSTSRARRPVFLLVLLLATAGLLWLFAAAHALGLDRPRLPALPAPGSSMGAPPAR